MRSDYRFSVAISFAGDNKRSVVRNVATILKDALGDGRVFFDEWFEAELAGPDAQIVLQNIYQKSSFLVVTCVCERYNEKTWTQDEWRAIQSFERTLRDAASDNKKRMRFLPLRFGDGQVDGLFDTAIVPDVRERTNEDIASLILERLKLAETGVINVTSTTVQDPAGPGESASLLPNPGPLPSRQRMPYPSLGARFAGRVEPLLNLHHLLKNGIAVVNGIGVVVGSGGLGKTQLAIEYVHRFGSLYQGGIYWVNAELKYPSAIAQLAKFSATEMDNTLPLEEQADTLWRELSSGADTTLVIYDNFPENEPLQNWLPVSSVKIKTLITTRRKDLAAPAVTLTYMEDYESLILLNSRERQFSAAEAGQLISMIGGLPLALELTSNYLNRRKDINIQQLVEEMNNVGDVVVLDKFSKKYRDELPTGHEKSITATFQISWNQTTENEQCILRFMACCAPTPIPRRLLHTAFDDSPVSILEDPVEEAVENLSRLSLIDLDDENDPFMHRLLRDFIRTVSWDADIQSTALTIVKNEFSRIAETADFVAIEELVKVTPHVRSLLTEISQDFEKSIDLQRYLCWYDVRLGRYESAKEIASNALELSLQYYPPDHISSVLARLDMGIVLLRMGYPEEAMRFITEALPIVVEHEPTGISTVNAFEILGVILTQLGSYEIANSLLNKVLVAKRQAYGSKHIEVAKSQANLGLAVRGHGDVHGAKILHEKAIAFFIEYYPKGHIEIAMSQSNLALVLCDINDLEGARKLLDEALRSFEAYYPQEHVEIAKVQMNLSDVHHRLGNHDSVISLTEDALKSLNNGSPQDDLQIANGQALLAVAKAGSGELEESRTLYEQSIAQKRK